MYSSTILRGRYGAAIGRWRFFFGPELRLNIPPTSVQVDAAPFWEIGVVSGAFTIDVATPVTGSLW